MRNRPTSRERQPAVYIVTSRRDGPLYTGVTSDLPGRIWQHKNSQADGFTKKYKAIRLVYYELHENMESAITRERRMKKWLREWKVRRIEEMNPEWRDLYKSIC